MNTMTTRNIMICTDCEKQLETATQLDIWKKSISKLYTDYDSESKDLRFLETMGYITSSEISEMQLMIKPCECILLPSTRGLVEFYCVNHDNHLEFVQE